MVFPQQLERTRPRDPSEGAARKGRCAELKRRKRELRKKNNHIWGLGQIRPRRHGNIYVTKYIGGKSG